MLRKGGVMGKGGVWGGGPKTYVWPPTMNPSHHKTVFLYIFLRDIQWQSQNKSVQWVLQGCSGGGLMTPRDSLGAYFSRRYTLFHLSMLSGASYLRRCCCKCCAGYRHDLVSTPYVWLRPQDGTVMARERRMEWRKWTIQKTIIKKENIKRCQSKKAVRMRCSHC